MFEFKVVLTKLTDGDTADFNIDQGFNHWIHDETVRLMGIDTPESRTSNRKEKILGTRSKEYLKEFCKTNKGNLVLKTTKQGKGKFGRILGYIYAGDSNQTSVNDLLIESGNARAYFGGSKNELGPWAKETGCKCGGKWTRKSQQDKCTGTWERWTPEGYVPFPDLYY